MREHASVVVDDPTETDSAPASGPARGPRVLTRDEILDADDLTTQRLEVPEWGDGAYVIIRMLTASERDRYERTMLDGKALRQGKVRFSLGEVRAHLVAISLVDEAGAQMFSTNDVAALARKSSKAIARIFDAARELNGMTEEDVEELVEGFDEAPSERPDSD